MKIQTTQKNIKNQKKFVIGVGYCSIPNLLKFFEPTLYNANAYGWRCDFHPISHNVGIVTGYGYSRASNVSLYSKKGDHDLDRLLGNLDKEAINVKWENRSAFIEKVQKELEQHFDKRG